MKGFIITVGWFLCWAVILMVVQSCVNLPPPAPMGDGAVQQYGLFNIANESRSGVQPPPPQKNTVVTVTDKGVAITIPKK
jgi:hypothetical protein